MKRPELDDVTDVTPKREDLCKENAGLRQTDADLREKHADCALVVTPHPLTLAGQRVLNAQSAALVPGETLSTFLARHGVVAGQQWVVSLGGVDVPEAQWPRVKPKHGHLVEARRVPQQDTLKLVAFAVLAYYTLGAGGMVGGSFMGLTGASGYLAAGVAFVGGSMLINKLLPPKMPNMPDLQGLAAQTSYSLSGGRNRARPFEPMALVLGEPYCVPDLAAQPYTYFENGEQYLWQLFHAGINCASVASLRIGQTPLANYQNVKLGYEGFAAGNTGLPLLSNVDSIAGALLDAPTAPGAWTTRTSSVNAVQLAVDLEASLFSVDGGTGAYINAICEVDIEYRLVGAPTWDVFWSSAPYDVWIPPRGAWTDSGTWNPEVEPGYTQTITPTNVRLTSSSSKPLRMTISRTVAAGQYEVRARKVTANSTSTSASNTVTWATLKTYQVDNGNYKGQARLGLQIQASGQLNGALDELNWVATANPMPYWNGAAWVTAVDRASGLCNPGAQILLLARGIYDVDGRLLAGYGFADTMIDIEALKGFMVWCAAKNFYFDLHLQQVMSTGDLMDAIAYAGLGAISWHTGKLGVIWFADDQPIESVLNMGTIKAKSFSVDYDTQTTADELEFQYFDRARGNAWKSLRVTAPGVASPQNTGRVPMTGIIFEAHAAILARFAMAQNIYQRKTVSSGVDLEHLTFRRGTVMALSHDMTQWGYGGRVQAAVNNAGTVTLTLDDVVPFSVGGATARYVGLRIPGESQYRVFAVQAVGLLAPGLYAYVLGDLGQTVRASTATYMDVDGVLKTAAVDAPRFECSGPWTTNLFRQSQNFSVSPWQFNIGGTGQIGNVTPGFAPGPPGFATADRIYLNRGAGNTINDYGTFGQYIPEMRAGKYYSYIIMIAPADPSQVGKQVIFNTNSGYGGIITLTSGWQQFTVNGSIAVYSNQLAYFAVRGTITANADVAFLLAYVQAEEGLTTTFYVPTATAPASQASPSAVTSLLVEGSDTNIATYSACGSAAAQASGVWSLGTCNETYQAGTAPDGSNDALKLTGNLAAVTPIRSFVATATSVVVKLRIKYVDATSRKFLLRNFTTSTDFDILTINPSNGTGSAPGWTVRKLANGWIELAYVRSTGISIGNTLTFYFGYLGQSTDTLSHLQWGFELKGADGSYIPTTTAPVTRAADQISLAQSRQLTLATAWPGGVPVPGDSAANPAWDTVWIYDFKATPGQKLRVASIEPQGNMGGARVALVPESEEFWTYVWTGAYTPPSNTSLLQGPPVCTGAVVTEELGRQGNTYYTELTATIAVTGSYDHAELWGSVDNTPKRLLATTRSQALHWRGGLAETWWLEVRPFSSISPGTSFPLRYTVAGLGLPPADVGAIVAAPYGDLLRLTWPDEREPDFAGYEVRTANANWGTTDGAAYKGPGARCTVTPPAAGVQGTWYVKKFDSSGNYSVNATAVSFTPAALPNPGYISYTFNSGSTTAAQVTLDWPDAAPELGLSHYEVSSGATVKTVKASTITLPADWLGDKDFTVKTVDQRGNKSAGLTTTITKLAPNPPVNLRANVIDNNVQFFWEPGVQTTLPVSHSKLYKGDTWATAQASGSFGRTDKYFDTLQEVAAGTETYWVTQVDTSKTESTPVSVTKSVWQPPDYVLAAQWVSDFSGTKSNALVEGGALVLPVNTTETWEQHFTNNGWATPQAQIDAGFPIFAQPGATTGYYEEVRDYGTMLASMQVSVLYMLETLAGVLSAAVTITVAQDAGFTTGVQTYTGAQAFASNFRYVKYRTTVTATTTAGIGRLTNLSLKLDAKLRTEQYAVTLALGGAHAQGNIGADYRAGWVAGMSMPPAGWTLGSGDTAAANAIELQTGPSGQLEPVWVSKDVDVGSDWDGGWNASTSGAVDFANTGALYAVLCKRINNLTDGATYIGPPNAAGLLTLAGVAESNPYFLSGVDMAALDTWYLLVGYVHKIGYGTTDTGLSGIYSLAGTKLTAGTEYKANTGTTTTHLRAFYYGATGATGQSRQYLARPVVIPCTEAAAPDVIAYLLRCAKEYGGAVDLPADCVDVVALGQPSVISTVQATGMVDFVDKPNPKWFNVFAFNNAGAYVAGSASGVYRRY